MRLKYSCIGENTYLSWEILPFFKYGNRKKVLIHRRLVRIDLIVKSEIKLSRLL